MGMWQRVRQLFGAKVNATLDRLEDPRESLEVAYRKELQALADTRRGVADVLTAEKRLEIEASALAAAAERATAAARMALARGDEPGARRELAREESVVAQRERLLDEVAAIRVQRTTLEELGERIRARVDRLRSEKLTLGARFAVARATTRAGEAITGLRDDVDEVGPMIERAENAARDAQARAAALVELTGAGSPVAAHDARIDARLRALREALPDGTPPKLGTER